jgi:hypothetical protein
MAIVKKISELTPKGSNLGTTDLLIVGVDNGTDYDLKSVTGAQLLGTVVSQTITDGVTSKAPSEDVVYDNLALKVDKVAGSRLITTAEGTILGNTSGTNSGDETVTTIKTKLGITTLSGSNTGDQDLSGKVDKIVGKGLSTEDYTTAEKSKLAGLSGTNTGDQTLQQVTDKGSTTTNPLTVQDAIFRTVVSAGSIKASTLSLNTYSVLDGDGKIQLFTNGVAYAIIKATNLASNITLELPNKTVGTYTLATTSDFSGTNTGDQTFLNARVQSVSSSATVTPLSTNDLVIITAQAVGLTLANPTGTFTEGQSLIIRIKDNGTARTIAFDTNYRAIGVTLPTTTVISKTLYLGIIYNSTDLKWDIVGYNLQA